MSQQYSLRWNNHQPNFISMFGTLLATKNLVDVTLAAEGQHLVAHKVVLSACSTYFHSLFVDNPSHHPIVILKDVTFNNLCTMVDFMYYGEVNVTEEQLPQVLETAKILKIKGLTEMPDSTSLTRSQGASADFPNPENSNETNRPSVSPSSPNIKRKRRRVSSTGSGVNLVTDDNRSNDCGQNLELMREAVTLSSLPQQKRRELDERMDNQVSLLTGEPSNINIDQLAIDSNAVGMSQEPLASPSGVRMRRSKYFKRQSRVQPDEREVRKQVSEPTLTAVVPVLQKHESYPQYSTTKIYRPRQRTEQAVGSLLIRAVAVVNRQPSTTATTTMSTSSFESVVSESVISENPAQTHRASHTPAVRSGPPLSCNFCWNTVDECGRILRRKTQYHCPECRTNLCIVPCFHEYHDGPEAESSNIAR
ncbi:zinc finger and BTB domain-containing protein 18-like isoform X3 [Vanessa tameamea]|uniref:Zinc finger and BTB domain-containing protein 18-like isoform X3 n=1 Tax=Vanessa tameamea TaxID=334116 RepID=A0A8B8IGM8_VANTA|nr:zinc finger and BTB domain-containing protein 18-like isoform X3 [Vanessa tameamea]